MNESIIDLFTYCFFPDDGLYYCHKSTTRKINFLILLRNHCHSVSFFSKYLYISNDIKKKTINNSLAHSYTQLTICKR